MVTKMSTISNLLFGQNAIWKALGYFLAHPSSEIYVKELGRILKIGPTAANKALKQLCKVELLHRKDKARAHFYSLNNELAITRSLKTSYFLARLETSGLVNKIVEIDEGLISLCIYGSYSDGTFDDKSDLDILIISQKEKSAFNSTISKLENILGLQINIEVFNLLKWGRVKKENKEFYQEVLVSHILVYGSHI